MGKIIFLIVCILSTNFLIFADNGVWHYAKDVVPGIFGEDENNSSKYIFKNNVDFLCPIVNIDGNLNMNLNRISKVLEPIEETDVANKKYVDENDDVNDADHVIGNEFPVAGNGIIVSGRQVNVNSNIMATKSYVDSKIVANQNYANQNDDVNDADHVIGNEYPIAGKGIIVSGRQVNVNSNIMATKSYVDSKIVANQNNDINDADHVIGNEFPVAGNGIIVSGRQVNVDLNVVATKSYVDSKIVTKPTSSSISSSLNCITKKAKLSKDTKHSYYGEVYCDSEYIMTGGGCYPSHYDGWRHFAYSYPIGNGWQCGQRKDKYRGNVYVRCCKLS